MQARHGMLCNRVSAVRLAFVQHIWKRAVAVLHPRLDRVLRKCLLQQQHTTVQGKYEAKQITHVQSSCSVTGHGPA